MSNQQMIVVGAGVFALTTALELLAAGCQVTMVRETGLFDSASAAAAGMLAPASEAVADRGMTALDYQLLVYARDHWLGFIEAHGLDVHIERAGTLYASPDRLEAVVDQALRLEALGASYERLAPSDARALSPQLMNLGEAILYQHQDWRLDSRRSLEALLDAAKKRGLIERRGRVQKASLRSICLDTGEVLTANRVILAAGWGGRAFLPQGWVTPIRGQLVRFDFYGLGGGPVLRTPEGYLVPGLDGPIFGATMRLGEAEMIEEVEISKGFARLAAKYCPSLKGSVYEARIGVRATTADGWPLIGQSQEEGPILAIAARRNGWLLGALVGEMTAVYALGDLKALPERFDARRELKVMVPA